MQSRPVNLAAYAGMAVLLALAMTTHAEQDPQGKSASCKYEANCDCSAPGLPIRWQVAYCMLLNATDDYENAGVTQCMDRLERRPDPALKTMTECDQNAYWKERICRTRYGEEGEARVKSCVDDPGVIPRVVEFGVGG